MGLVARTLERVKPSPTLAITATTPSSAGSTKALTVLGLLSSKSLMVISPFAVAMTAL